MGLSSSNDNGLVEYNKSDEKQVYVTYNKGVLIKEHGESDEVVKDEVISKIIECKLISRFTDVYIYSYLSSGAFGSTYYIKARMSLGKYDKLDEEFVIKVGETGDDYKNIEMMCMLQSEDAKIFKDGSEGVSDTLIKSKPFDIFMDFIKETININGLIKMPKLQRTKIISHDKMVDLFNIIKRLNKSGLVHRDIHWGNIMNYSRLIFNIDDTIITGCSHEKLETVIPIDFGLMSKVDSVCLISNKLVMTDHQRIGKCCDKCDIHSCLKLIKMASRDSYLCKLSWDNAMRILSKCGDVMIKKRTQAIYVNPLKIN
jgi:hypothetical protein